MSRVARLLVVSMLAACGGPALQNVPHPNNAAIAGTAAAVAAALTLADPAAAGRKPEADIDSNGNAVPVKLVVPADVFDRAEQPQPPPPPTLAEHPRAQPPTVMQQP